MQTQPSSLASRGTQLTRKTITCWKYKIFPHLRMSLSRKEAKKKNPSNWTYTAQYRKNPQYSSRSIPITRKKWMLIKLFAKQSSSFPHKYKHAPARTATQGASTVRKLQGWKAGADATEGVDGLKVKFVSGIFQLEKLIPFTCCGKMCCSAAVAKIQAVFKKRGWGREFFSSSLELLC